jgi:SPP1 family predicted phage head-tail adaptor
MRAGKMDRLIEVQSYNEVIAPSGAPQFVAGERVSLAAELVERAGLEVEAGYGEAQENSLTFRIRYRVGIKTADRVRFENRNFSIERVVEIGRKKALELTVKEVT